MLKGHLKRFTDSLILVSESTSLLDKLLLELGCRLIRIKKKISLLMSTSVLREQNIVEKDEREVKRRVKIQKVKHIQ